MGREAFSCFVLISFACLTFFNYHLSHFLNMGRINATRDEENLKRLYGSNICSPTFLSHSKLQHYSLILSDLQRGNIWNYIPLIFRKRASLWVELMPGEKKWNTGLKRRKISLQDKRNKILEKSEIKYIQLCLYFSVNILGIFIFLNYSFIYPFFNILYIH